MKNKQNFEFTIISVLWVVFISNYNKIKKLSTREKILLELQLAILIGVDSNAIKPQLAKLKRINKIKRIGSTKAGYWEVI